MKTYLIVVAWMLFFIASFGFALPYLFSATDDYAVIGGVALLIITVGLVIYCLIKIYKKMKKFIGLMSIVALLITMASCRKDVPAGYAGVKVYLLGSNKGVDNEALGVGRWYIGINEELYLYPTYHVNYSYTKSPTEGSTGNEEFSFQTKEGMECFVDIGCEMHFDIEHIAKMFQIYRKGVDEIQSVVVRNAIRDALNKYASTMNVESVYGQGKSQLFDSVQAITRRYLQPNGIVIDKLNIIGSIRIPDAVKKSLDAKVSMTQEAQAAENEVAKEKAKAEIAIAKANGEAQAIIIKAHAQAQANKEIAASISSTLVQYRALDVWDGHLPQVSGGNTPFINVGTAK